MSRVGYGRLGLMGTVDKARYENGMFLRPFHSNRIWSLEMAEVEERVMTIMKNFESIDDDKLTVESHFANDLKLDSLDTVELLMAVEEEFDLVMSDEDADKLKTVKETIEYIHKNPEAKEKSVVMSDEDADKLKTVKETIEYIHKNPEAKEKSAAKS
eukprot:CAMPEP_0184754494 /NCGR_PEP_ID=MMETSP0315-20130426/44653_1 /TAXON_ID=101924 /ORGANISM="Rhodosorus marinus, Strain UTEX LB 2760" /LENGTH=156 /DNA_ID=CAMNT_0027233917 /DNA_START=185 /DNA_END=655 /DNA_ORIENTATION=-